MTQVNRLARGGLIDRSQPLQFSFDGKILEGFRGDTLAAALLANGMSIVDRSFKRHRPRGVLSAGIEEPNALVAVEYGAGIQPIARATVVPLADGLKAKSLSGFPSVNWDTGRLLDFTHALWPAGFYNKVFKWPSWHAFEGVIRRLAGLGRVPVDADRRRYRHRNRHCDVLVVGAGPAGLRAALDAAVRGADVLLVDQDSEPGGCLLHDPEPIDGLDAHVWLEKTLAAVAEKQNIELRCCVTAVGFHDHNVLTLHDQSQAFRGADAQEYFWIVRAGQVVVATGAIEQPIVFHNNDLPGVMLAGSMRHFARRYAVRCGRRVVGIVNNDQAWLALFDLHVLGIEVAAVLDTRATVAEEIEAEALQYGIDIHKAVTSVRARGSRVVEGLAWQGSAGDASSACDAVAVSGGLNPTVHLYSQAGGKLQFEASRQCFLPDGGVSNVTVVGAAAGEWTAADKTAVGPRFATTGKAADAWIDYHHDVTVADIELAVQENFASVEHLKRYTTTGMAVDQGKTSNLNALSQLAKLRGSAPGEIGTTTFRPMYAPVTLGAIAGNRRGEFYSPPRRLPMHDWHARHGAVFDDYGGWKRPAYYGESREAAIRREAVAVRESVGLFDSSPLGKIEVRGPDAAEFLGRMYVNTVATLQPGRVRYGLMLNENGVIIDDGVFVRLAEDHFLINTTSGNADRICSWLDEWRQCEWPNLDVVLSQVTSQWAVATLAGPRAHAVLNDVVGQGDLTQQALPHMGFCSGHLEDGTPARLQRVSFTGELSYELSCPAGQAAGLFERLQDAGAAYKLELFGIEALQVLRIEKGFLHVGSDTDGTTNPFDVGFGRIVENKQTDFIGARSLQRATDRCSDRRQLVGFRAEVPVIAGGHFVTAGQGRRSEGFVTSACHSPTVGAWIGLGLLERGFDREGDEVLIFDGGALAPAKIVAPCFVDPDGARLRD